MVGSLIMSTTPGGMLPMNILVRASWMKTISVVPWAVMHEWAWSWTHASCCTAFHPGITMESGGRRRCRRCPDFCTLQPEGGVRRGGASGRRLRYRGPGASPDPCGDDPPAGAPPPWPGPPPAGESARPGFGAGASLIVRWQFPRGRRRVHGGALLCGSLAFRWTAVVRPSFSGAECASRRPGRGGAGRCGPRDRRVTAEHVT